MESMKVLSRYPFFLFPKFYETSPCQRKVQTKSDRFKVFLIEIIMSLLEGILRYKIFTDNKISESAL